MNRWLENPYWQYFCGYDFLQTEFPAHPTSLTRWRKRLGKEGLEQIFSYTIRLGVGSGTLKGASLSEVTVDTTVMPKNISYPTDAKLLYRGIQKMVAFAKSQNIPLRQSYKRVAKHSFIMAHRYAHARQMRRCRREQRKLKTYLGRLYREMDRKGDKEAFSEIGLLIKRLLTQERHDKEKLYSLHEPGVSCISKSKAHKKYEFGTKVSLSVTNREGFALSLQALKGAPYDGHTLQQALDESARMTGGKVKCSFVDRGYRGHGIEDVEVLISGRRNLRPPLRRKLKRRQAIEPMIGHMKSDGKLGRCYLKGHLGDQLQVLLCGVGHNLRMILRHLRLFLSQFMWAFHA